MSLKDKIKINKCRLNLPVSLFIIFTCAVAVTYFIMSDIPQPDILKNFIRLLQKKWDLRILNFLPVLVVMLFVYFLSNNAILSAVLCSSIFILMSIGNRIKVFMRQDPFTPTDLLLVDEVVMIFKNFGNNYTTTAVIAVVAVLVMIVVSLLFFGGKKMDGHKRLILVLCTAAVGLGLHFSLYASQKYYDSFPTVGNVFFKVNQYASKGFLYSFLHDMHSLKVAKPPGYERENFAAKEEAYDFGSVSRATFRPNIIMVMGEAYSDISLNKNLDFKNYIDPMINFKAIAKEPNAISGHVIVPNFGGGTADTEFDVLTGYSTRYIDNATPSYNFIKKEIYGMPQILKNAGYDTLAIHPGESWFYNRKNVYEYMGFDQFINLDNEFDIKQQNKGMYINEIATIDSIIDYYEKHKAKSKKPLFTFCVTIQNHGPYEYKYGIHEKNFDTKARLTKNEEVLLANYFQGAIDADIGLDRLVEYFRAQEEPTIIVYFGDHLPGFTGGIDFLNKLDYGMSLNGTPEQRLNVYKTPYLIWENDSAKKKWNIKREATKYRVGEVMSSNYLGISLMEMLGYKRMSPYLDFANQCRKTMPVSADSVFVLEDGTAAEFYDLDPKQAKKVEEMKGWTYFKMFDQNKKE